MSNYNPRGGYESRSLLNEAIYNRVVREFELESLYKGSDRAAVEIMHKYDGTRQEMAWVLQGDSFTKSTAVFTYIDSIIKQFDRSKNRDPLLSNRSVNNAMEALGVGADSAGLGGGHSKQQEQAANQAAAKARQEALSGANTGNMATNPSEAKQGLGSRFKTWAKERAAPALGRGLRHMGAGLAGGLATGNPLGVLAGVGGSMYQAHKGKQSGQYDKVMGGEGGLNQLAGDAAKQGAQAVQSGAQQQAQNFQTGQGAAGTMGKVAGTMKNLGGAAVQGMKNMGQAAVQGVQNAYNQAGATQQANLQQQNPDLYRQQQRAANAQQTPQQPAPQQQTPPPATPQPTAASGAPVSTPDPNDGRHQIIEREPTGNAQVDPAAAGQVAQQQAPQGAGMFAQGNQAGVFNHSNDTFSRIHDILKGN